MVCNLCGAHDARVLFRKDSIDFMQCRQCGLEWVHPLPDMEEMRELYSSPKYYRRHISQCGYSDYVRNKHLYVNLFNRRLDEILRHTNGNRGRLLDVGAPPASCWSWPACAAGRLVALMSQSMRPKLLASIIGWMSLPVRWPRRVIRMSGLTWSLWTI